jgi:hypothetical protein
VLLLNAIPAEVAEVRYVFVLTLCLTVASALHYVYLASTRRGTLPTAGGS